jgi:hypothetical protein
MGYVLILIKDTKEMPKVYLVFKTPDEADDLRLAQQGADFYGVLFDLDNELRSCIKHGTSKVAATHAQKWRDRLSELLMESSVEL